MKKKTTIILLLVIGILGSFIAFYSFNMLFSDLSNMFYGTHDAYIITSIPLFMITLDIILSFLFVIRLYRRPEYKKAMIKLYSIYMAINGAIGTVTSIMTGRVLYHSFLAPYPFPLYSLLMLIVNILLMVLGLVIRIILVEKVDEDLEKRKMTIGYMLFSAALFIVIMFAFDKFGAILWSPVYTSFRSLDITIWFYIWILIPPAIIIYYILDNFKVFSRKGKVIFSITVTALNIILGVVVYLISSNNPLLISSVSPIVPLERLATMPVNFIAEFFGVTLYGGYMIYQTIHSYLKHKNDPVEE